MLKHTFCNMSGASAQRTYGAAQLCKACTAACQLLALLLLLLLTPLLLLLLQLL
jgi:hypothetical protein